MGCPTPGSDGRGWIRAGRDASRQGGFLHLSNWRYRAFAPAAARACLAGIIPYNGRDTFASLLIHEGRPPILVAAALGHGDTQTLWRHYAGVFAEAEHVARMPIAEAVQRARDELRAERDAPTLFPCGRFGALGDDVAGAQKARSAGETSVRAAGFEPATSGSGADPEGVSGSEEGLRSARIGALSASRRTSPLTPVLWPLFPRGSHNRPDSQRSA